MSIQVIILEFACLFDKKNHHFILWDEMDADDLVLYTF